MDCDAAPVKVEACKDTPEHLRTWKGDSAWAEKGAAGLCGKKGLHCTESWFVLVKPRSKEQCVHIVCNNVIIADYIHSTQFYVSQMI